MHAAKSDLFSAEYLKSESIEFTNETILSTEETALIQLINELKECQ